MTTNIPAPAPAPGTSSAPSGTAADDDSDPGKSPSEDEVIAAALAMVLVVLLTILYLWGHWPSCTPNSNLQPEVAVFGVSPARFAPKTDIALTVHGRGFSSAATAFLDGSAATAIEFISTHELRVRFPGVAKNGVLGIVVKVPAKPSAQLGRAVLIRDDELPVPPPKVESISPTAGPVGGDSRVIVRGSDLGHVTSVTFGGIAASDFWPAGDSALVVVTPPHVAGTVDLFVGSAELAKAYTFSVDECLLMVVAVAGTLGGALHALRSLRTHLGTRSLLRRWMLQYYSQPWISGGLAVIFYLLVAGGFQTETNATNAGWMVGLAALVGLFSDQAFERLLNIATGFFAKSPDRGDEAKVPKKS